MSSLKVDLGPRRYDLDWVRIGAFMLLILYHVGMYYVTWDFHVKSPHASPSLEPLMMLTSPWRLSLLFLVSGVATAHLLARGGRFMRSRSARLLIPLVFGMAVIVPPQTYLEVVEKVGYGGSFAQFYRLYMTGYHGFCREDCLIMPTWNHLWFVAYLWVYTLVLYLVVSLAPRVIPCLRQGAERIAEVGARFTLDAIPGKHFRRPRCTSVAHCVSGSRAHRPGGTFSADPRAGWRLVQPCQLLPRIRARIRAGRHARAVDGIAA